MAVRSEIAPEIIKQFAGAGPVPGIVERVGDFKFSWAASGTAIYFERTFRGARNIWQLTVDPQTLEGVAIERVTTGPGLDAELSLSADGTQLAFTSETQPIRAWMFPFDAMRGRVTGPGQAVTSRGLDAWLHDLSPDGKKLAFCRSRAGKWELREKSLADGRESPIVADDSYGRELARWSPDGTSLAYTRLKPSTRETQIVEWSSQSRSEEPLTAWSSKQDPMVFDWSPGKWLLVSQANNDTGRYEIWQLSVAARPFAEIAAQKIIFDPAYLSIRAAFPLMDNG